MNEKSNDILNWIEHHLPERFELLVRTNRDYDGRSGVHGGMWYLHLIECIPGESRIHRFSYKSWYSECSDNLISLLDDVAKIVSEVLVYEYTK